MAETTQAQAPVAQGTDEASILSRLSAVVDLNPADDEPEADTKPRPAPEAAPQKEAEPAEPAPSDTKPSDPAELTAEDLPDDTAAAPQSGDEFEIVHNGQQVKLTRADVIQHAQQGFDYSRKAQAVAEQAKQLTSALEISQQLSKVQEALADDLAAVKSFERQLKEYENVDWVAVATNAPLEYPKHRAAFDQLQEGYRRSLNAFQQKAGAVSEGQKRMEATKLQQEFTRLQEIMPQARDSKQFEGVQKDIREWTGKTYTAEELDSVKDARFVQTLWESAQYRKLLASKASKSKLVQDKPPVTRPSVPNTPQTAAADKDRQLANRLKKSGSVEDATALYLSRLK